MILLDYINFHKKSFNFKAPTVCDLKDVNGLLLEKMAVG